LIVEGRRLGFVNAELNDRNICRGRAPNVHPALPAMGQATSKHAQQGRGRRVLDTAPDGVLAEPAEIVDCPWRRADCYVGVLNAPVRRHTEDCLRTFRPGRLAPTGAETLGLILSSLRAGTAPMSRALENWLACCARYPLAEHIELQIRIA
jgi:hypothetical protein